MERVPEHASVIARFLLEFHSVKPEHEEYLMPNFRSETVDSLDDFEKRDFNFEECGRIVYVSGSGPAVIVMTEMPGISPQVARFARWIREAGFSVYMPSLFGRDGAVVGIDEAVAEFRRVCISAEFKALADGRSSLIVRWLRRLAHVAHSECGGNGVGAVGMCFTGNFALSLMLDAPTLAPVVCQPTLPLEDSSAIDLNAAECSAINNRLEREDLSILAYRFEGDKWCTSKRFDTYRKAFGSRFDGRVIPDCAANPDPPPFFKHVVACPHSVVTAHLVDEIGQPTITAKDEIVAFLQMRLQLPLAT